MLSRIIGPNCEFAKVFEALDTSEDRQEIGMLRYVLYYASPTNGAFPPGLIYDHQTRHRKIVDLNRCAKNITNTNRSTVAMDGE